MPNYELQYMAHAIISGKSDVIDALKSVGLVVSDSADEEWVFRLVLENKDNAVVKEGIRKVLVKYPYHQHCLHCIEAIQSVYEKGVTINRSMNSKDI
jgi:hypothetical protein